MKKQYGIATLPSEFRKLVPEELAEMLDLPVCSFYEGDQTSYTVRSKKSIRFTIDTSFRDGINGFFHELCHFVAVPEIRCGVSDFGFIYDPNYGYPLPKKNYPAVLHEAEVLARERNLARYFGKQTRDTRDTHYVLRQVPGYYNYLDRHPGKTEIEIEKLIQRFEKRKSCQASVTLNTVQRRLDLLSREPWRISRKRLSKT